MAVGGGNRTIAKAHIALQPSMQGFFADITTQLTGSKMQSVGANSGKTAGKGFVAGIGSSISTVTARITSAVTSMAKLTTGAVAGVGATVAGLSLYGGISRALNIEDATQKLSALGNSAEATKSILNSALLSVKGTAFALDEATSIAAGSTAAGVQQGEALTNWLKLITDTATISGASLNEIGTVFNRVQASGRAYTQEINMLADRGLPIFSWLAKEMSLSMEDLRKEISAGAISTEIFAAAIENNIGGAAKASADTTTGAFRNMRTAFSRLGASLTGSSLPAARLFFLEITEAVDKLNEKYAPALGAWIKRFSENGLSTTRKLITNIGDILRMVFNSSSGRSVFDYVFDSISGIRAVIGPTVAALAAGMPAVGKQVQNAIRPIFDEFTGVGGNQDSVFTYLANGLAQFAAVLAPVGQQLLSTVLPALVTMLVGVLPQLGEVLLVVGQVFADTFIAVMPAVADALRAAAPLIKTFADIFKNLVPIITPVASALAGFVSLLSENTYLVTGLIVLFGSFFLTFKAVQGVRTAVATFSTLLGTLKTFHATLAASKIAVWFSGVTKAIWLQTAALRSTVGAWILTRVVMAAVMALSILDWITKVTGLQWLWNAAMAANPIAIVIIAVVALVAALAIFFTQTELGKELWAGFVGMLSDGVAALGLALSFLGGLIAQTWGQVGQNINETWNNIIGGVIGGVNYFITMLNYLILAANMALGGLSNTINSIFGTDFGSFQIGFIPQMALPQLGTGGDIMSATALIAGEKEPESIVNRGLMNNTLEAMKSRLDAEGGEGTVINNNVTINQLPGEDIDETLDRLERRLNFRGTL